LKLNHDKLLSNFAFKFTLRRCAQAIEIHTDPKSAEYIVVEGADRMIGGVNLYGGEGREGFEEGALEGTAEVVGRCRLNRVETSVYSAWFQRLKVKAGSFQVCFQNHLAPLKVGAAGARAAGRARGRSLRQVGAWRGGEACGRGVHSEQALH